MPKSKLFEDLKTYMLAGFPALWVNSLEPNEAAHEIVTELIEQQIHYIEFDIADGFRCSKQISSLPTVKGSMLPDGSSRFSKELTGFFRAINQLRSELSAAIEPTQAKLVILIRNAHFDPLLGKAPVHVQLFQRLFDEAKLENFVFVMTGDFGLCPKELRLSFMTVDHALPTSEELIARAKTVELTSDDNPQQINAQEWADIAEAARGLTASQAENAFALSLVRTGKLAPAEIWSVKAQELKKSGLLEICEGLESFSTLGGVEGVKDYARTVLNRKADNPYARPKSLLFLGVPGGGKSAFVKALGRETNRRVLRLDLSSLRSKYQGESENNVLAALRLADSMEPCILFLDEIEKAFAGVDSDGSDGGTSKRIFGSWLTWLNDHTTDVLVIGTANDASQFPPAFTRAERFDGTFFFDVPTEAERAAIWRIYWPMFFPEESDLLEGRLPQLLQLSEDWTGAEIRHCCRQACMRGSTVEAVAPLVPVYAQKDKADLQRLRKYAEMNLCWSATRPDELYKAPEKRRAVQLLPLPSRKVTRSENN